MSKHEAILDRLLLEVDIPEGPGCRRELLDYGEMLYAGLLRQRLTGEKTLEEIVLKQICDSLYLLKFADLKSGSLIDLGTGGGLPGIPLKICRPGLSVHLIDSNRRKMDFLQETVDRMALKDVHFMYGRAETFGQEHSYREQFDYLVSKAVADMKVLAELALPLVRVGGKIYFYKGPRGFDEAEAATYAIEQCGGAICEAAEYSLSGGEKRVIFIIDKIKTTPAQYPRAIGKPSKRPLQ